MGGVRTAGWAARAVRLSSTAGSGRGPANRTARILDSTWSGDKVAFRTTAQSGPPAPECVRPASEHRRPLIERTPVANCSKAANGGATSALLPRRRVHTHTGRPGRSRTRGAAPRSGLGKAPTVRAAYQPFAPGLGVAGISPSSDYRPAAGHRSDRAGTLAAPIRVCCAGRSEGGRAGLSDLGEGIVDEGGGLVEVELPAAPGQPPQRTAVRTQPPGLGVEGQMHQVRGELVPAHP